MFTRIDRWDGGIMNDPRDPNVNTARMVTNFDILTNPKKMTPYRNSESGDSAPTTSQKQSFCIALRSGTTYKLYALGVVSGTGRAEVLMKGLTTGEVADLDDNGWDTPSNNQSSAGTTSFNLFVYYKRVGLIFGARAGTAIWAFDPSSSAAWADSHQALTYTNIGQGIVHSKDDILYIPYDNKIAKNNNGTWTVAALTLPEHYVITSISEYGNFLAIGVSHISGVGNSQVYLWDRDATLTTLSDSIDWGEGSLMILAQVEGILIGISQTSGLATSFASFPNSVIRFKDRVIFRALLKGGAKPVKTIIGGTNTQLPIPKQVIDNRVYFMMRTTINSATREGVWSFGRNELGEWALVHERTPNNATDTTSGVMKGFFVVGDYMFISYTDDGDYALSKTNDTEAYTTSIWERRFVRDANNKYELKWLSVTTEALPSGTQVVVKYKKDSETSFSSAILTHSTANALFENINSQGASLPKDYNELELRLESTGAEITSLEFEDDVVKTPPYA